MRVGSGAGVTRRARRGTVGVAYIRDDRPRKGGHRWGGAAAERGCGAMAFDFFKRAHQTDAPADRLPPGQYLTKGWPVLNYGDVPRTRLTGWTFRGLGLVGQPQ